MHKILSVFVVSVWAVMLFFLAGKTHAPVAADTFPALQKAERDSWMGIYLEGGKIGYAHELVEKTPGGYRITEEVRISLTVMDTSQEMRVGTVSELDRNMALSSFVFNVNSGPADMRMKGSVSGRAVKVEVETSGRKQVSEIPVKGPVRLASGLELLLESEGLEPGKKLRMPFFDPSTLSEQYMDIIVEAKEELKLGDGAIPVYRVKQEYAGVSVTSWVNPDLGTIKSEGLMGFTFLMETKEQAMSRPEGGYASTDIIALTSVPVDGDISDPRGASYLKAELSGAKLSGLEISGGRQTLDGVVVSVQKEGVEDLAGYDLPYKDKGMEAYLAPSTFVQSDDPKIEAQAAEIIGGEKNAMRAARKLSDWVYKRMDKRPVAGIPSAVEVLGSMQGDCNEHTVLYTALARSAGIPARMDAGIVMLGGRFYYHAWPEVYVGEWVSLDPTFGQFPADATHIRMVEGGPDKQVAILKLIGNLKVKILEHG